MKHIIKLLLLAAVTLPGWVTTTAQEATNGRTKKVFVPVQSTEDLKTVTAVQPEERMIEKEDACGESTLRLSLDRSAAAPAPVFAASPSRADIAPISTNEKVTRYRWGNQQEKEVCQGSSTYSYLPLTVEYLQYINRGQMIYPKNTIGLATGSKITSISFHTSSTLPDAMTGYTNSKVTLSLGETTQTTYSSVSFLSTTNVSTISTIFVGSNTLTFVLDHPYIYNGGNLVVNVYGDGSGTTYMENVSWYGVSQSGYTAISQISSNQYRDNFLPWMTVGYQVEEKYWADAPVSGNKNFFHAIEFTWPINEPDINKRQRARLDTIATDPDQMIGMLYEVYTNKAIPGNWKRGYAQDGHTEPYDDVAYTGVGAISHTGTDYTTGYSYANDYGWGISSDIETKLDKLSISDPTSSTVYLAHMDSTQYKPNQDGLTLLLIEMRDDYTYDGVKAAVKAAKEQSGYTSYDVLKARIGYAFKSVRVITESMRSGSDDNPGTLFKIDCDKMNKFFMVAKGQARNQFNSNRMFVDESYETDQTYCRLPLYAYCADEYYIGNSSKGHAGWMDYNYCDYLAHMYEQFSPYDLRLKQEISNVYQLLVNMGSYGVPHDCISIPDAYATGAENYIGHYFRMYKDQDDAYDCQDVRDLMFFVPDNRMKYYPTQTITDEYSVYVADGSDNSTLTENKYVPFYGELYNNTRAYSQMVYPSDMLESLDGKKIRSITFYTTSIGFGNPNPGALKVTMGKASNSYFPSETYLQYYSGYVQKTVTPTYGATELTITFDETYTYTKGDPLIVDVEVATAGTAGSTYWKGINTSNYQSIDYHPVDNRYYRMNFLPTMKVTYEETSTSNRDSGTGTGYTAQNVKYMNYNSDYRPSMALYVIRQDTVSCPMDQRKPEYYKLTLTWDSNMDDFLPGKKQEYNLLQLVQDELGNDKYIPVYYTNSLGQYLDGPDGNVLPNQGDKNSWEPVVLTLNPDDAKTYADVYVQRTPGSQQVTYAIQGRDEDHFLSLQISNQQSYFIPGTDPAEMALLGDVAYYSRYNPQNQKNCYSNKLVLKSNPQSILPSYVGVGTEIRLKRYTGANDDSPVTVATAVVTQLPTTGDSGKMDVTLFGQSDKTEYPTGKSDTDMKYAGYHANNGKEIAINNEGNWTWKHSFYYLGGYVDLGALEIYDNFTVGVSDNKHPAQYLYQVEFETATSFTGLNGSTNQAYSNTYRIPVYKTESKISARTLDEVLGDTKFDTKYSPSNLTFEEKVQMSSKTEIYRYDAYRWLGTNANDFYTINKVGNNDAEDLIGADGIASNQGEGYTVSMNKQGTDDYYTTSVAVSQDVPGWARFVDCVPAKSDEATLYTYAPVVELFTKGVDAAGTAHRSDINTYGGPMQTTAVGKLELVPYAPQTLEELDPETGDPSLAQMSEYTWYNEGKCYSYYNLMFNFKALDVPAGYELYKLRAWRRIVDKDEDGNVVGYNSILGEELDTRRAVRIGQIDEDGWYMYEDINFGDPLEEGSKPKTMTCGTLHPGISANDGELLGHRPSSIPKPTNPEGYSGGAGGGSLFQQESATNPTNGQPLDQLVRYETRATFGALRMKIEGDDSGSLDKDLNAEFKVRAYFTKNTNPLVGGAAKAPGRDGETVVLGGDFDYYVAEGTKTYTLTKGSSIITGISAVKMDANREVVGVTYVNPVGQMSSTPWQGVNMVVTRYSDGSTTTQKVIR